MEIQALQMHESAMSTYTKETLAALLNGREYGDEITRLECAQAKTDGLVVVFGYSDDNAEFRGAIEVGCYDDGTFFVTPDGDLLPSSHHDCDCDFCGYQDKIKTAKEIKAVWGETGYSWTYKTDIPHATFDIMEDGKKFCRGIVFDLKEVA
jgi:hypothetical protein